MAIFRRLGFAIKNVSGLMIFGSFGFGFPYKSLKLIRRFWCLLVYINLSLRCIGMWSTEKSITMLEIFMRLICIRYVKDTA